MSKDISQKDFKEWWDTISHAVKSHIEGNYKDDDTDISFNEWAREQFRDNINRWLRIKKKYDKTMIFSNNQGMVNIKELSLKELKIIIKICKEELKKRE